jgi:hypothetical protein
MLSTGSYCVSPHRPVTPLPSSPFLFTPLGCIFMGAVLCNGTVEAVGQRTCLNSNVSIAMRPKVTLCVFLLLLLLLLFRLFARMSLAAAYSLQRHSPATNNIPRPPLSQRAEVVRLIGRLAVRRSRLPLFAAHPQEESREVGPKSTAHVQAALDPRTELAMYRLQGWDWVCSLPSTFEFFSTQAAHWKESTHSRGQLA